MRLIGRPFEFQHTAARRRLECFYLCFIFNKLVSTHSRPKAAGFALDSVQTVNVRFNTQPPEGGWGLNTRWHSSITSFNTQPPEGGWGLSMLRIITWLLVSTHSRPKAAGYWYLRH